MRFVKDHPGWVPAFAFSLLGVAAALHRKGDIPWWVWPLCFIWFIPVLLTCWERES